MSKNVTLYDIVLSCPTDIDEEKNIIDNVINEFNTTIGESLEIRLNLKHWSTDSYAQSGGAAQDLLNKQFIDSADMIICIFGNRMGTPTKLYDSGTAEEMLKAINNDKQVFLYFSDTPVSPSDIDLEQRKQVTSFRTKVEEMEIALYKTYNSLDDFKAIITKDLNLFFLQLKTFSQEINKYSETSNLCLSGIDESNLNQHIILDNISKKLNKIISDKKDDLIILIDEIKNIVIVPIIEIDDPKIHSSSIIKPEMTFTSSKVTPYMYSKSSQSIITNFAQNNNLDLGKDFFSLGNLKTIENVLHVSIMGGSRYSLKGTDEEIHKQKLLEKLQTKVLKYLDWVNYSNEFENINLIKLALSNTGNIFQSDISVKLKFLKTNFIEFKDTNPPGKHIIKQVIDSELIDVFFGETNSVNINAYGGLTNKISNIRVQQPILPGYQYIPEYTDLVEEYFDSHESLHFYEKFEQGQYIIQKYHFKELKQHTNISFPTALLFRGKLNFLEIEYEIISKENPHKIESKITTKK